MSVYLVEATKASCRVAGCACHGRVPHYPSDVTDAQWALLRPEAEAVMAELRRSPAGRPMEHDLRAVLDAIGYVTRYGIEWRALPVDFLGGGVCLLRAVERRVLLNPAHLKLDRTVAAGYQPLHRLIGINHCLLRGIGQTCRRARGYRGRHQCHRHQTRARHKIRLIEPHRHRTSGMKCLYPVDALLPGMMEPLTGSIIPGKRASSRSRHPSARRSRRSGGRRESHPPAPADPGVIRHRALVLLVTRRWRPKEPRSSAQACGGTVR
jgi:transposase